MKVFIILSFLISSLSFAGDSKWKIVKDNKTSGYRLSDGQNNISLEEVNLVPKLDGTKKYGKNLEAISFLALSYGTTETIEETRAALYDHKNKKFLGIFPYSNYSSVSGMKTSQPKWIIEKNKLVITDSDDVVQATFDLE